MDPFTAAMLAGTALQIYGNYKANMDEAAAERQNQMWMEEQARWIAKSTERELGIYDRESKNQLAATENAFAVSGISMEGSAMSLRQQEEFMRMNELDAIAAQGNMQLRESYLKISASGKKQAALTDPTTNIIQGLALGLGGIGKLNKSDFASDRPEKNEASSSGAMPKGKMSLTNTRSSGY